MAARSPTLATWSRSACSTSGSATWAAGARTSRPGGTPHRRGPLALSEATLSAKPMIWGSFCDPLLPVNSHVAVDVTERMVRSEVEQPAAGLDPMPLVGAFGDLADQVGLTRDRLGGSTQLCFERF